MTRAPQTTSAPGGAGAQRSMGIPGCLMLTQPIHVDARGWFTKPYDASRFDAAGLRRDWAECFTSLSHRGVIRGFHLQLPPSAHDKLLWVITGASHSALLDLRKGSPAFGRVEIIGLDASRGEALYVPQGVAHAFQALEDDTLVVYLVTSVHDPARDGGVRFDSAGVSWPIAVADVSVRDLALPSLDSFVTPFRFGR